MCDKCDLYQVEDEEMVVKEAKERAEQEWWEQQGAGYEGMKEGVQVGLQGWAVWLLFVLDIIVA